MGPHVPETAITVTTIIGTHLSVTWESLEACWASPGTLAALAQAGLTRGRPGSLVEGSCEAFQTISISYDRHTCLYKEELNSFSTHPSKLNISPYTLVQYSSAKWSRIEQLSESSESSKEFGYGSSSSSLFFWKTFGINGILFFIYSRYFSLSEYRLYFISVSLQLCSQPTREVQCVGLMSDYPVALCHSQGYRVVFNNVDVVSRLLSIIIWEYMLRDSRGGPLMVTAQYVYSSTLVIIPKTNSQGGYSSVSGTQKSWVTVGSMLRVKPIPRV